LFPNSSAIVYNPVLSPEPVPAAVPNGICNLRVPSFLLLIEADSSAAGLSSSDFFFSGGITTGAGASGMFGLLRHI